MSMDIVKKLFKKNKNEFDMYNNDNSDNCKDKYNNIIYLLTQLINDSKKHGMIDFANNKYDRILDYNKDALILYLNMVLDVLTNQSINEVILGSYNLSFINDLNGNLDFNTINGKKNIISQIRNAFAHKSGKINFFIDNGVKKVRIDNKSWFSIEANLEQLNKMFEDITIVDSNNEIQMLIKETNECIENKKYRNIPEDASIILRLNQLMCYNKESIFDRFMQKQTSFIDASIFDINSTSNWDCTEAHLRNSFFDKYDIIFHSDEDKTSYKNEWKPIVDISTNVPNVGTNYIYNIKNMPFDSYTGKHIPIPIFLNALRNANCHGRIKMNGDEFIFFDQNNGANSQPYFYMSINKKDLLQFLSNDYFIESIFTTIDKHQNEHNQSLYLLERAEGANTFSNYMDVYKARLQGLSETDVVKYMYDNNKFSSYLMEYPNQVQNFFDYQLSDGTLLIDYLKQLYNENSINRTTTNRDIYHFIKEGLYLYNILLSDQVSELKKIDNKNKVDSSSIIKLLLSYNKTYSIELEGDYDFFNIYYSFLRNLKSIQSNIKFKSINELTEEEKNIIKSGAYELKREFLDSEALLSLDNMNNNILFIEIGMQQSKLSELRKIYVACELSKKKREKYSDETKRYTIKNVEKRSALYKSYVAGTVLNINEKKIAEDLLTITIFANFGLMAVRNICLDFFKNTPLFQESTFLDMFALSYGTLMVSNHLYLWQYYIQLLKQKKSTTNGIEKMQKYLDRSDEYETGVNGRNNIKHR